jgi:hypothetical protein
VQNFVFPVSISPNLQQAEFMKSLSELCTAFDVTEVCTLFQCYKIQSRCKKNLNISEVTVYFYQHLFIPILNMDALG